MRTMQNIPFLLPIPATTYSSSVWMAWGTLNQISKTRTPYMHKRVQSWPQVKTQNPLQRFLNWNPILEKIMEEQKKSCMTNDSASPFKVSSKLAPSFFRPNDLHHEPGKTNSPSSVLEEHKANPLWFNTWALPIVEVILPQSWDLKAMVSEATFCLEKSRANMLSTKTTCQQHSKKKCQATNSHHRFRTSTSPAWRLFNEDPS